MLLSFILNNLLIKLFLIMIIFFLVLIINFSLDILCITLKSLELEMPYNYKECKLQIYFPKEHHWCLFPLNTYISYSIIDSKYGLIRNEDKSSFYYTTNIELDNSQSINNISFFISNATMEDINFGLSFGYHHTIETSSIVHNLYQRREIDKKIFAFEFFNNKSSFHIGGIQYDKQNYVQYKGSIKINENFPTWGFELKEIMFHNVTYKINLPVIINSASNFLFDSDELYELFSNFHKVNKEDTIDFIFHSLIIKINARCFNNNYSPSVMKSSARKDEQFKGIIFGTQFLELFNYTIFDYDKKQIEFYSDRIVIIEPYSGLLKRMILLIEIICVANIIIIIYQQGTIVRNKLTNQYYLIFRFN